MHSKLKPPCRPESGLLCSSVLHGADVDMTEYEVLGLEPLESAEFLSQSRTSTSGSSPITPSVTPQSASPSAPPAAPEQPEGGLVKEVQAASSSPQLRLSKRKAPEVFSELGCCLTLTSP